MTDGDEHWLGAGTRAQHHANLLALMGERHSSSALVGYWRVPANQQRFRAADRRDAGEQSDVACDTEAARVGDPLAIADQQIGSYAQLLDRRDHCWSLAEG